MSRLPSAYQEVEYIQSDVNSYIRSGVIDGNENLAFSVKASVISYTGYGYVLGCWSNDSEANTVLYLNTNTQIGGWVNKAYTRDAMHSGYTKGDIFEAYADKDKYKFNNVEITSSFEVGTARTGEELYIFRRNGANGSSAQTASIVGRIYNLKFWDNDILIRDFMPCYRKSDNEIGMYDLVNGTFYTNAGTGTFIAGAEVIPPTPPDRIVGHLPSGYSKLAYLESTGTQYIQTNVSIQNVRRAVGDVAFTSAVPNVLNYVVGVRNSVGTALGFGVLAPTRGGFTCYPFEWKTNDIAYAVTANEKIHFDTAINETNTTFKVNGTARYTGTTTSASSAGFTGTRTITIGALMTVEGTPSPQYLLYGKVFNIKMYDGSDNLIFNGIPAKNPSNVLGLYDTVSETFLTNAGTGTFVAGPDITPNMLGSI